MDIQFLEPMMLLLIIPIFLIILYLIKREFVKVPEDIYYKEKKRKWRRWVLISRTIIAIFLVIALAEPYGEITKETTGDPRITILIDNSTSMEMFDLDFVDGFLNQLKDELPVNIKRIGSAERSDLGEGILANMDGGQNILLISDGYNNDGANLGDVSLFASSTNSTISAIDLTLKEKDIGVSVIGPQKIVQDLNNTFLVRVTKPGVDFYHIVVTIDGQVVLDADTDKNVIYIDKVFKTKGYHTISAEVSIDGEDHFPENNNFYKVVNVIEKPKILYVTEKTSPLELVLRELYEVTKKGTLPNDIDDYYAIVINDMPAEKFRQQDVLSTYLIEGNGMVVFGGFGSFDRGNYKNSLFEQLLPVKVGNAERKFSDNTIVLAIDRSKGGGKCRTIINTVTKTKEEVCSDLSYTDVIKAQAVELIEQLDVTNRVGAIAFDTGSYLVEPVDHLYTNKKQMIDKIKKIVPGGNTLVSKGIQGGYTLISNEKGNRYIILLTDGITWIGDQEESIGLAGNLFNQGIKLITVGIGRSLYEEFLITAAGNGGGFYLSADNKGKLKVLFGDPEKKKDSDTFSLFVVNTGHFITRNLDPNAIMTGFNQVLPKSSAELLVSTDSGEPALTVWRYGLGKVAVWNTFAGNNLGELLNARNSIILTRTVNWAIGDPERKKPYFVNVEDARIGNPVKIEVKSDKIPSAEGLSFVKIDKNLYEASLTAEDTGFGNVLDAKYAVNYPREYEETGFNEGLTTVVSVTGGNIFKHEDVDAIVKFVRSVSKRTVVEKTTIVWPFLVAAIIIFLTEVLLRRISENKLMSR